jgi:hypothetical protein
MRQELTIEFAEQSREAFALEFLGLGDRKQLHEKAGQLDKVILGAPRMAVPRPDGEARAAIKFGCDIEIADSMNDVVETVGHGHDRLVGTLGVHLNETL